MYTARSGPVDSSVIVIPFREGSSQHQIVTSPTLLNKDSAMQRQVDSQFSLLEEHRKGSLSYDREHESEY